MVGNLNPDRRNAIFRLVTVALAVLAIPPAALAHERRHRPVYHHIHAHRPSPHAATASYYGWPHQGRRMANGHRFHALALTAASKTLPLGTRLRVTNLATHRSVLVLVTDRMGARRRALDLSLGAAREIGMQRAGLARVRIQRLG
ncbi:MAG: septal ring lytic transglycosylase RlpA family protein [Janthinobacterium lividum]